MMVLTTMILLLIAGHLPLSKGHKHEGGRILGGTATTISQFPFVVSIQSQEADGSWLHRCVGSILSKFAVLTAGHCFKIDPSYVRVVAGSSFWADTRNAQVIGAQRYEKHPLLKASVNPPYQDFEDHDAGVIVLRGPFQWTDTVQPLTFFSRDKSRATRHLEDLKSSGAECHSPGWGIQQFVQGRYQPSPQLKQATPRLLTTQRCLEDLCRRPNWQKRYYAQFCLNPALQGDKVCGQSPTSVACSGDSGGPLVCGGFVVGVYSWRSSCEAGWPFVYTGMETILEVADRYLS